jgi:hypothetical protein
MFDVRRSLGFPNVQRPKFDVLPRPNPGPKSLAFDIDAGPDNR